MNLLSEKYSQRHSGIEVLRLLSMFFVLLLHANYVSFGELTSDSVAVNPLNSFARIYLEQFTIIAVNVYVLISGWFGIKSTKKGLLNILLQVLFYTLVIIGVGLSLGKVEMSSEMLSQIFVVGKSYWFVVSYVLLYILAPVLNAFVQNSSEGLFRKVLISFFVFQSVYGWFAGVEFFATGYSAMSFIGLYLLSRYVRLYIPKLLEVKSAFYVLGLMLSVFVVAYYSYIRLSHGHNFSWDYLAYNFPLNILNALLLLLVFVKLDFRNKWINYCSSSCLAVYLIHVSPYVWNDFIFQIRGLYDANPSYVGVLNILAFLLLFYVFSIVVDKIRILIMPIDKIYSKFFD